MLFSLLNQARAWFLKIDPVRTSVCVCVCYGGPLGRAMRLFLRDDLYATTPNFYAMVAYLDALITNLNATVSILLYCCMARPFTQTVYRLQYKSPAPIYVHAPPL